MTASRESLRNLQKLDTFWTEIIQTFTSNPEIDEVTAKDVLADLENLEEKIKQLRDFPAIEEILDLNKILDRAKVSPNNLGFIDA